MLLSKKCSIFEIVVMNESNHAVISGNGYAFTKKARKHFQTLFRLGTIPQEQGRYKVYVTKVFYRGRIYNTYEVVREFNQN